MSNLFDVSVNSVIDRLPADFSQITATTTPVNSVLIADFIEEASADLIALLKSKGVSTTNLDDTVKKQMQRAVRTYAAAESLKAFGLIGDQYTSMRGEYERIYSKWDAKSERIAGVSTKASGSSSKGAKSKYLNRRIKF